jgi:aspartyl-tRNA synthetase
MLRTHSCGELRLTHAEQKVTLCGWVQTIRDKGSVIWVDIRDRYGITQLLFEEGRSHAEVINKVRECGREYVIKATGLVIERINKNPKITTGDIEILVEELDILNASEAPPFTIEDESDGGDELRMKYRYLDLRRNPLKKNLTLRNQLARELRNYLWDHEFMEIETPFLIKSTPEGARDFVVPSRLHHGQFYALPQSPQTFKQLLMVSGYDRYFQIVRCFRDEDLRADRQPEFTQIDCEMAFVEQNDILGVFEGMIQQLFKNVRDISLGQFPVMTWDDAMHRYGSDKPDLRFGMEFCHMSEIVKGHQFKVFDDAETVVAINATGCAGYTRKQTDELTDFVKRPQVGASGMIYLRYNEDGTLKSSVDKFYNEEELKKWAAFCSMKPGDLLLVLAGKKKQTLKAMCELRLEMGNRMGLRDPFNYKPLWVTDFPLLEWDEETQRFYAMHHPFTSPKPEHIPLLKTDPGKALANAYDLVINGVEIGGGSIRIHNRELQNTMFNILGFSDEEAQRQFGFLLGAFRYGAPPHGGIALGFDRLCSLFGGSESIRDYIAFPKNNAGRDLMIDAPDTISPAQLNELHINIQTRTGE